jgi:hypothetical protein
MRRRDFIGLLGGAVAWPIAACATKQADVVSGPTRSAGCFTCRDDSAAVDNERVEHDCVGRHMQCRSKSSTSPGAKWRLCTPTNCRRIYFM